MSNIRLLRLIVLAAAFVAAFFVAPIARAGGPLLVINDRPVIWERREVRGGPLNSQTVDAQGRVLYRVDTGRLGPLSEERAVALVDRIFSLYTNIPTASIEFVNAGAIRDPDTGNPVNVTGSNAGRFISSRNPTFQNPIIFDSDGSITGGGGVLGFFGFLQLDAANAALREGFVVLNGSALNSVGGEVPFLGVFTHEFGHFAGPLDHAQINGRIAQGDGGIPLGLTTAQAYDLYAPFTETLYPFVFDGPSASALAGRGFTNSGSFIATLDLDTQNALSNLYPADDYAISRGAIEGRVLVRTAGGDIPLTGVNVVARRIDQGPYPSPAGTQVFPGGQIPLDADNVPLPPPAQAATDSLATVSSAVTGLEFGTGAYRIQGLPPGQYLIEIQEIISGATRGSSIGPLDRQLAIPFPEFYNGPGESGDSTDSPADFTAVTVIAGAVASGIDIILNGIASAAPARLAEQEPNDVKKKEQRLTLPVIVEASAADSDLSKLRMSLPGGFTDKIEDLFRFTVDTEQVVFILMEATSGAGDLDMYLFTSGVSKKSSSLDDPNLVAFSAGPTSTEILAVRLMPGTYILGVSAFAGSQNYRLQGLTTR